MGITTNIQTRLLAIERTMQYDSSAVYAAAYVPEDVQPNQLPLFINFPDAGRRVQVTDTEYRITRTWTITLWGRKEGDGGRAENELRMHDLIDAVYDLFLPRPRLELNGVGLAGITAANLLGDDGPELRPYPEGVSDAEAYYVVEFGMEIEYRSLCT